MKLVRFADIHSIPPTFSAVIDRMFDEIGKAANGSTLTPKVDIFEDEQGFELQFFLPGFKKEEISIDVSNNQLTVSGERVPEKTEGRKCIVSESGFGKFSRNFNLPEEANADAISASFRDGVLHLTIAKKAPEANGRKIQIQ
jgi:HSP20 family protein